VKVKLLRYLVYSCCILLLVDVPQVRADRKVNCTTVKNGSACTISDSVINNYNYYYASDNSEKQGTSNDNDTIVGDFKFKLLGCNARQDKVRCDVQVLNTTPQDRTIYVASKQLGGISSLALRGLGVTTMIDINGSSYQADAVSFANQSGDETGQSYFTVYSGTRPKLSVVFTGVDNPATISRLDLLVGESKNSQILYDKIQYSVKPRIQKTINR